MPRKNALTPSLKNPELKLPFLEIMKSIPEFFGIRVNEEPEYKVAEKTGAFEIRDYASQRIARLVIEGASFDEYREQAFRRLAHYIFGGNSASETIAMTAPVLQQAPSETIAMTSPVLHQKGAAGWAMTFVLPSQFVEREPPAPLDPEIELVSLPAYRTAALSYGGNNTLQKMKEHELRLRDWVTKQSNLRPEGDFFFAQYDAPFVLPFVKRNDVQVKVTSLHS